MKCGQCGATGYEPPKKAVECAEKPLEAEPLIVPVLGSV